VSDTNRESISLIPRSTCFSISAIKSDITEADIGGVSTETTIDRGSDRRDVSVPKVIGTETVGPSLIGIAGGSGRGSYTSGV
jgi:hypothetical protein